MGRFLPAITTPDAPGVAVYLTTENAARGEEFATAVARELAWMSSEFGDAEEKRLSVVELPDDSVSAAWGPGVIAIKAEPRERAAAGEYSGAPVVGSEVSPATLNDAWITQRDESLRGADGFGGDERQGSV